VIVKGREKRNAKSKAEHASMLMGIPSKVATINQRIIGTVLEASSVQMKQSAEYYALQI